jgi:hypothetical protein
LQAALVPTQGRRDLRAIVEPPPARQVWTVEEIALVDRERSLVRRDGLGSWGLQRATNELDESVLVTGDYRRIQLYPR